MLCQLSGARFACQFLQPQQECHNLLKVFRRRRPNHSTFPRRAFMFRHQSLACHRRPFLVPHQKPDLDPQSLSMGKRRQRARDRSLLGLLCHHAQAALRHPLHHHHPTQRGAYRQMTPWLLGGRSTTLSNAESRRRRVFVAARPRIHRINGKNAPLSRILMYWFQSMVTKELSFSICTTGLLLFYLIM